MISACDGEMLSSPTLSPALDSPWMEGFPCLESHLCLGLGMQPANSLLVLLPRSGDETTEGNVMPYTGEWQLTSQFNIKRVAEAVNIGL